MLCVLLVNLKVFTVSDFEVDEVLKGSFHSGEKIQIKQLGGMHNGKNYIIDDEVYLKQAAKYILYLAYYGESEPLTLVNPTQGYIELVNKKTNVNLNNRVFTNGLEKEQLLAEIRTNVAKAGSRPKIEVSSKRRAELLNQ
ncbi:hypothetical protein [Paenibacillus mesotrionivorans]|uniref:Uncharacterized protein n=1 Tax=Paenibacillus mesotrionivorans TaxID=3160968 RepID=A0ACC7NYL5_9BACL